MRIIKTLFRTVNLAPLPSQRSPGKKDRRFCPLWISGSVKYNKTALQKQPKVIQETDGQKEFVRNPDASASMTGEDQP